MKVSIIRTRPRTAICTVRIVLTVLLAALGNLFILSRLAKGKANLTLITSRPNIPLGKPLPFGKSRGLIHVTRAFQPKKGKSLEYATGHEVDKYPNYQIGNVPKQTNGYLSSETLATRFRSQFMMPGSEEEGAAVRLMSVRRLRIVNPHKYDYVISPSHVCASKNVKVVIVIVTSLKDFASRQQFRHSIKGGYAGIWNDLKSTVLLFFVGSPPPDSPAPRNIQTEFTNESNTYGDIVQATYTDTYKNLSLKSVSILKWVSTHCSNAQFLIKADGDCDINIPLMMTELNKKQKERPLFMLGKLSRMRKPLRDPQSKWYIPTTIFGGDTYPQFLYGGCQGYPLVVAKVLYEASLRIPLFHLEDVYISGLCASLVNIPRYDSVAFYFTHLPPPGEKEY